MKTDFKSDFVIGDTLAFERGTFTHEGRDFTSGGFLVDLEHGRMFGYVKRTQTSEEQRKAFPYMEDSELWLTSWEGTPVFRIYRTDTGGLRGFGGRLYSYATLAPYLGYYWYGRGQGEGMCLRMKRGRKG